MTEPARAGAGSSAVDWAGLHRRYVVCGTDNPRGLGLTFTPSADGRGVEGLCACDERVEGYGGLVHGGVVSMLLDGAMAHCLFHMGCVAHTAELTVRFRHPVLVGREARVRAWLERSHARLHVLEAGLWQDGRVKATATAKFLEAT